MAIAEDATLSEVFPSEIFSRIIQFYMSEPFTISVTEKAGSRKGSAPSTYTVGGIPDFSDIRLVNHFFDEEVRASQSEAFDQRLELKVVSRSSFSAKTAQLFHPHRGHLSWILPLISEVRVDMYALGPAVLRLVDQMSSLKRVIVLQRSIYRNNRASFSQCTESDVVSGNMDHFALSVITTDLEDAPKETRRIIERLQLKSLTLLMELELYEHMGKNWPNHVPFDSLWVFDLGKDMDFSVVHRATAPLKPLEL